MRCERVHVGGLVVDLHVHLALRGLDAGAHGRPERARGLAVGDDRDPRRILGGGAPRPVAPPLAAGDVIEGSSRTVVPPHPANAAKSNRRAA